jgi:hypothetical protein
MAVIITHLPSLAIAVRRDGAGNPRNGVGFFETGLA